eukprot:scaffold1762_cov383-Prasinococcus_capsulatus_cf.AAC.14
MRSATRRPLHYDSDCGLIHALSIGADNEDQSWPHCLGHCKVAGLRRQDFANADTYWPAIRASRPSCQWDPEYLGPEVRILPQRQATPTSQTMDTPTIA